MKKSIKTVLAGVLAVTVMAFGLTFALPASNFVGATDPDMTIQGGVGAAKSDEQPGALFGTDGIFTNIINAALFLIGAISVLMLIYGGIRYTLSAGNATNVTAAKNTILYAIVGIVVALLAFAIVNFVLTTLGSGA